MGFGEVSLQDIYTEGLTSQRQRKLKVTKDLGHTEKS